MKRWGYSIHELLKDPAGREHFGKFLEKEFSAENLKYVEKYILVEVHNLFSCCCPCEHISVCLDVCTFTGRLLTGILVECK